MLRALLTLDRFLHWSLDWYITRTLPGWGRLQLWQHHVCEAYENRFDEDVARRHNAIQHRCVGPGCEYLARVARDGGADA